MVKIQGLGKIIVKVDRINNDTAGQVVNSEQYEEEKATVVNTHADFSRIASVPFLTKPAAN